MGRGHRRIAVVSSFPPTICGIAQYAEAQARKLEAEGVTVERVALAPALGRSRVVATDLPLMELLRLARGVDELWVHYQVSLFYNPFLRPLEARVGAAQLVMAAMLAAARSSFVVVHETQVVMDPARSRRLQAGMAKTLFRAAKTLVFHTERERRLFTDAFFPPRHSRVIGPGAFYTPRARLDRGGARARLGIRDQALLFLCIGFFDERKDFEGFARAFGQARTKGLLPERAELAVVSSLRPSLAEAPPEARHAFEALRRTLDELPDARLVDEYVSDEDFDHWLVAADWAVAPYRTGFTSSIAARAALYGVPSLLRDVGGLSEQRREGDVVYGSDDELAAAFRTIAERSTK